MMLYIGFLTFMGATVELLVADVFSFWWCV